MKLYHLIKGYWYYATPDMYNAERYPDAVLKEVKEYTKEEVMSLTNAGVYIGGMGTGSIDYDSEMNAYDKNQMFYNRLELGNTNGERNVFSPVPNDSFEKRDLHYSTALFKK